MGKNIRKCHIWVTALKDNEQPYEAILLCRSYVDSRDDIRGNVYDKALKDGVFLFSFGTAKTELLAQLYKKRWRIECDTI